MKDQLHTIKKLLKKKAYKLSGKGLRVELKKCERDASNRGEFLDEEVGENIQLYWWNDMDKENLGDYLFSVVVNYFAPKTGGRTKKATIYAIGSIIGFRIQDAVVWGSGFLDDESDSIVARAKCSKLDVRAVRGPKTRKKLKRMGINCPKVFGDPVLRGYMVKTA